MIAGRTCPLHHRYTPALFREVPTEHAATVYAVGGLYGNPEALAGWGFACDALAPEAAGDGPEETTPESVVARWFTAANVRVYLSSHTCLPVMAALTVAGRRCLVANNGATGMPNSRGTRWGLITRVSTVPAAASWPLYGSRVGALQVDAVPLHCNHRRWVERFVANWPEGSPAHRGYHERIDTGTELAPDPAKMLSARWTPTHRP